ncbi:HipA domain-containing protein [Curtobacterium citreum]
MPTTLTAYLHGARVGWFTDTSFTYDPAWVAAADRQVFALALPATTLEHEGPHVTAFLQGLLPDDDMTLARWATRYGTTTAPTDLLAYVGGDVAGAVQFTASDHGPAWTLNGMLTPVTDADIAAHLRTLRDHPEAWDLPSSEFALGGFQSKFTLTRTDTGWAVPSAGAASTHIVKPGMHRLPSQAVFEHLTMHAARAVGITAAETTLTMFEDMPALVVTRYDRTAAGRVHQEDLMQALGLDPAGKYQAEGGPGINDAAATIHRATGSTDAVTDYLTHVAFHWATMSTDAHAKNTSVLHTATGTTLAPLYDAASMLAYPHVAGFHPRQAKLAMKVGKTYTADRIEPRHLHRAAAAAGADADIVLTRARNIAAALPDVITREADRMRALPVDGTLLDTFAYALTRRCAALVGRIDDAAAAGYPSPGR